MVDCPLIAFFVAIGTIEGRDAGCGPWSNSQDRDMQTPRRLLCWEDHLEPRRGVHETSIRTKRETTTEATVFL